jgi:hypothetical protein
MAGNVPGHGALRLSRFSGRIAGDDRAGSPRTHGLEWVFHAFGLVVAVIVTVYVTRLARQTLRQKQISN